MPVKKLTFIFNVPALISHNQQKITNMNLCCWPFVSSGTAHVQENKKQKNSLNPINQALKYCTIILVEATTSHRPETSSLKAVYEYRSLAQGQSKRPSLLSLVLAFFFSAPSLASGSALAALPAFIAPVLFLILVVNDLHLQAADVERYGAQPEEGSAGHYSRVEQHSRQREEHDPPQSQKTAHVRRSTERHAHSAQDEERWGRKGRNLSEQEFRSESDRYSGKGLSRKRYSTISSLSAHVTLYKRNNADPCCQETIPEPGQKSCKKMKKNWCYPFICLDAWKD